MDFKASFPPVVSAFMQSNARHRFILGPFGSGKSFANIIEVVRRATMQARGSDGKRKSRIAIVRNTLPQLRDTTMKSWFDVFPNGSIGYYKETGKTFFIKQDDIECEVIFRALDDASDVKNLLSLELTAAWLNEFRDIHRDIVEALDGRIGRYPRMAEGGPSWTGIFGDSNMPEEGSYWERMCEGIDPDDGKVKKPNAWEIFKQPSGMLRNADGSFVENPVAENRENLPPGYYPNLVNGKTDEYVRTYVMCEYGRSKGGKPVHPMFNRELHVAKSRLIPNKSSLLLISADFGLTPAIVLKQQDAFGRVCTFDEIVTFGMGLDRAITDHLLPLIRNKYDGFDIFVTGDPSGNTGSQSNEVSCVDIFNQYRHKGLGRVKLAISNSPVKRMGATDHYLSRLIDGGKPAYLIDPTCEWLIQGLGGKYAFKKLKDGSETDVVEKNDWSHVCEANEYGDMYYQHGGRRKAEEKEAAAHPRPKQPNIYALPR